MPFVVLFRFAREKLFVKAAFDHPAVKEVKRSDRFVIPFLVHFNTCITPEGRCQTPFYGTRP